MSKKVIGELLSPDSKTKIFITIFLLLKSWRNMPRKKAILKLPLAWLHNQGDDVFQIPGNKNQ
jgi:hypothetical protein